MTSTLHIVVAMKPLDGNFASNAIKHGVAGLNIDACRIGTDDNLNGGAYSENGNRKAMDGDERMGAALGMFQPGKTVGSRFKNPQGRFPANVILSHKKGCRLVGTSKVGGDKPRGIDAAKSRSWKNQSVAGIARVGYADADGKETTEVWECEEGCPVKAFPTTTSGVHSGNYVRSTSKTKNCFGGRMAEAEIRPGDSGSAARFFKQVKED